MHYRRIATFVLGAWLAGGLIVMAICFSNFAGIDEVRESKDGAVQTLLASGRPGSGVALLRFMVAVEDSHLLSGWELAQAPLGLLAAALLALQRQTRLLVAIPIAMLLLAGFQHVLLMPEIAWLSQSVVLGRDTADAMQRSRLASITKIYAAVETIKFLLGMGLACYMFMMKTSSGRRRRLSHEEELLLERQAAGARLRP